MLRKLHVPALAALAFTLTGCGGGGGSESAGSVVVKVPPSPAPLPSPSPVPSATPIVPTAPPPPPPSASSAAELVSLLRNARGGEIIYLAPGRYDPIAFQRLQFDVPVTITSADPNDRAELTGLVLRDSKGVKVVDLKLTDLTPEIMYDFRVQDSSDIVLDKLLITSVETSQYNSGPLMIRGSTNVTVTRSEIAHVKYGVSMLENRGISITGNYFHHIRIDGIRGGGNSDIEIRDNLFTDFFPNKGDHPDAIQFWTTNTTTSAHNIRIADNVIVRGAGTPMQGIFMRDEIETLPYRSVSIDGNTIIGTMYHGIKISHADRISLSSNRVTGLIDQKSWLAVPALTALKSNAAQVFHVGGVNVPAPAGNSLIPVSDDTGASYARAWLAVHRGG